MSIRIIPNHEIDREKWDQYIHDSLNGLIYAHSVYLDHMSEGWCALMDEESGSMMPLPLKRKFGITYSYQPPFVQQLGVFSKKELNQELIKSFLQRATGISKSVNLYLNFANSYPYTKERCNYILHLNRPFANIRKQFRDDLILKPLSLNLKYSESSVDEVLALYKEQILFTKNKNLSKESLNQFEKLSKSFLIPSEAFTRKVISPAGKTLSAALFFLDKRRIYYIMSANSTEGRTSSANAFLLHEAIREYAGKDMIFDFEGSEIPGVKFFFEKFSPLNQPYFQFTSNRLNFFERTVKNLKDIITPR